MPHPSFEQTESALRRANLLVDAAEAHGIVAGLICTGKAALREDWLDRTFAEADAANAQVGAARRTLEQMWNETADALGGMEMKFEPMLPDDEDFDLQARVDALAEWCGGFMFGVGLAEIDSFDKLPPDVSEVLKDFNDIARGNLVLGEDAEADEQAYAELAEYIKVGTQLIHDELNPVRPSQFRAPPGLH